jgi:hypothetical protein
MYIGRQRGSGGHPAPWARVGTALVAGGAPRSTRCGARNRRAHAPDADAPDSGRAPAGV